MVYIHALDAAGLAELSLETSIGFEASIGGMQGVGHDADMAARQCSSMQRTGDQVPRAMLKRSHDFPWLLPFTDMFSKRRQFAVDGLGRVHLIVGKLWFPSAVQCMQNRIKAV